jgi:tryptophan synthase alpha chain
MINFNNKKGFIPFITAGDPNMDSTLKYLNTLVDADASLIEIGIPFSDPIAEGSIIMEADERALSNGANISNIFELVKEFRKSNKNFPLCFMTYLNPLYAYGYDKFFKTMQSLNMQGIIIPDLPYEEMHEVKDIASKYNISTISFIAQTSIKRIEKIASSAEGFIYLTSFGDSNGNTIDNISKVVNEIKKYTDIPVCIEFDSLNNLKKLANVVDGIIASSSIESIIATDFENAQNKIFEFTKEIIDEINK